MTFCKNLLSGPRMLVGKQKQTTRMSVRKLKHLLFCYLSFIKIHIASQHSSFIANYPDQHTIARIIARKKNSNFINKESDDRSCEINTFHNNEESVKINS